MKRRIHFRTLKMRLHLLAATFACLVTGKIIIEFEDTPSTPAPTEPVDSNWTDELNILKQDLHNLVNTFDKRK